MREMSIVVVRSAKLWYRRKVSAATAPTSRVGIMDGADMRVIRRIGILALSLAIIVVCEQGHGRSFRSGLVIVRRWPDRDDVDLVRRGTVEHAANGLVVGL